ncbi:DinB family protein [Actinoplanes sp. DH11]|uniref:DinB family protein n=1 Tax=Actinoplanes sp. DH11 TaxID=2857011 RepID=UPI001E340CAB|nr:DinB family protein [Actinoplanes sp. DH11]
MGSDWNSQLRQQLDQHWRSRLRPRLEGLTDDEYFWEPVPKAWSVRPRGTSTASMAAGGGDMVFDWAYPAPDPPPVTTIAWRFGHIIVGVLGVRIARHFGGAPMDYLRHHYAGSAAEALAQLDTVYAQWVAGVTGLGAEGLAKPSGEEGYGDDTMGALILHINREVIHHGAEIALLRDLYLRRQ